MDLILCVLSLLLPSYTYIVNIDMVDRVKEGKKTEHVWKTGPGGGGQSPILSISTKLRK